MKRRQLLAAASGALGLPAWLRAQAGRVYRVCSAHSAAAVSTRPYEESFLDALRELGFERGRNLDYAGRNADGDPARLPGVVDEVLALKPDLLFGIEAVARVMRGKTTTIPIVLTFSSDPVGTGLAQSPARPGGNVTGVTTLADGLAAKSIELLVEIVPKTKTLAVLLDPGVPSLVKLERPLQEAARTKGVRAVTYWARDRATLEQALATIERDQPDALLQPAGSGVLFGERLLINESVLRLRLPYVAPNPGGDEGPLLSYAANLHALYRLAASYAARILNGANPAELPIEQPKRFELVLNLKVAQAIGVKFPQAVLLRADKVIE
jgi:putative tryptophan/tyrosine transport system substrate-binding protein